MLTQERLKELLHYDPTTGIFTWITSRGAAKAGSKAGHAGALGYISIRIDGVLYQAHRLAWIWVKGVFPENGIDHRDLDGFNNRFDNLREATQTQNNANHPIRKDNRSGAKGVSFHSGEGKWRARVHKDGREVHLGWFSQFSDAVDARAKAAAEAYGDFVRTK